MSDKDCRDKLEGELPVEIKRCCVTGNWEGVICCARARREKFRKGRMVGYGM